MSLQLEMEVEESPAKWEYLQRKIAREELERAHDERPANVQAK